MDGILVVSCENVAQPDRNSGSLPMNLSQDHGAFAKVPVLLQVLEVCPSEFGLGVAVEFCVMWTQKVFLGCLQPQWYCI